MTSKISSPIPNSKNHAGLEPALVEIKRIRDGEIINAVKFMNRMPYSRLMRYKSAIKDNLEVGKPAYVCPICGTNVCVVQSVKKQTFFRHKKDTIKCPIKTRGEYSRAEILRMAYAYRTESKLHKKLKSQIILSAEADNKISTIVSEQILKGKQISDRWRKPDVRVNYKFFSLVFEAQVNSTFLDVILARRRFYKKQEMCLIWVFPKFNPFTRRVLHDDIINQHKGTAFVVDEDTVQLSKKSNKFMLHAWQFNFKKSEWIKRTVSLADLEFDPKRALVTLQPNDPFSVSMTFKELVRWYYKTDFDGSSSEWKAIHELLSKEMEKAGFFGMGGSVFQSESLKRLIRGIETAKTGTVFGWNYTKLNQVAHLLSQCDLGTLVIFLNILKSNGHYKTLLAHDINGKWIARENELRSNWRALNTTPISTVFERNIARYLYPEIESLIKI